jgi:mono/diheme cytochrome c family protein
VRMELRCRRSLSAVGPILAALLSFVAVFAGGSRAPAAEAVPIDFLRDVQPIFVEHCYQCHGPDKQEAGLRLDQRDKALAGGDSGAWFVAGKAAESEIVRRVLADEAERMPPVDAQNKPLSAEQIATIKSWIDAGAAWPEANAGGSNHWSFQPIARPAPPAVQNEAWIRNPIDRFVL